MSMLNIAKKLEKLKKHEACNCKECSNQAKALYEAKADTQRLIDFAGEDLAKRFIDIKNKLKAPENDLYYWIKNKSVAELEQTILNAEGTTSITKAKKDIADKGAKLICDTAHWKVYHITTFEAAQKYGRDSQWCITGVNSYGDRYWKQYTDEGVDFYFAITKENYNPRGEESKFAFAVYPDGVHIELYNQVDYRVSLYDMPHYSEINIPGVDLDNIVEEDSAGYTCDSCGCEIDEGEEYQGPDGEPYCEDCFGESCAYCFECGETFYKDDIITSVTGDWYCENCWDAYLETDIGDAESIIFMSNDIDYFETETPEEALYLLKPTLLAWNGLKAQGSLRFSQEEIEKIEDGVIAAAKKAGVDLGPKDFTAHDYSYLDCPEDTGYYLSIDGSSKVAIGKGLHVEKALEEIVSFINSLTPDEKDKVGLSWRCASEDFDPKYDNEKDFMANYDGELIVSVYSKAELGEMAIDDYLQDKTIANYEEAEDKIRAALGIPEKIRESLHNTSKKELTESYKPNKNKMSVLDEFSLYESLWK